MDSQVDDEVVGRSCRRCKEDDYCYDPVEEQLFKRSHLV